MKKYIYIYHSLSFLKLLSGKKNISTKLTNNKFTYIYRKLSFLSTVSENVKK